MLIKLPAFSFALLIGFFYAGDMMLKLFQVDIASFAVAGAFVIFLMSLEMILDIEIFKNQGPIKEATLVPLVFPLLAGAGGVYYVTFPSFGVCSCKHCCSLDIEYGLGLCGVEVDRSYRTFLG